MVTIIVVMQEVFLTWLFNNAPILAFLVLITWLGWTSRDALAKVENRISRLESDFQTLVAVLKEKKIIKGKYGRKKQSD